MSPRSVGSKGRREMGRRGGGRTSVDGKSMRGSSSWSASCLGSPSLSLSAELHEEDERLGIVESRGSTGVKRGRERVGAAMRGGVSDPLVCR